MQRYKLTIEDKFIDSFSVFSAIIVLLVTFYPMYYILIYSLNEGQDALRGHLYFYPRVITLENYKTVFSNERLLHSTILTFVRTFIGTVSGVFFTAMIAYGLSKDRLIFRKTYSMLAIITMYFSGGLIPTYLLLRSLGLINTFWVYIIPSMFNVFHGLLFMAFFREIPQSLEESAKVDGANDFYIFIRIVLPLSKPVLATIALFVGVNHWNDWFTAAFFINSEKLMTLPVILMRMISDVQAQRALDEAITRFGRSYVTITLQSIRYTTLIVTVLPITLLYPFVQKYFIQGMLLGSIKA